MWGVIFSLVLVWLASGCDSRTSKLDEEVFLVAPGLTLKLVRYHEYLPLHYSGEVFRVMCSSPATESERGGKMREMGWKTLGGGPAIGSRNASELVPKVRKDYRVIDGEILVWLSIVFNVSYDGCHSFITWDPTTLPPEMLQPVEKPDYCQPSGGADCRYYDFLDENHPRYSNISATREGHISFDIHSTGLKDGFLHIKSDDGGRNWQLSPR